MTASPKVPNGPTRIGEVVLLTRDRTAILEQTLERYLRNTRTLNRTVRFHVFDDAVEASTVEGNADAIRKVSSRWGCRIAHVSRGDRARWVDTLLREAGGAVSHEVVRRGLLGPAGANVVTGANRNAISLSMIDRAILCSDDDVAPPVAPMFGLDQGIRFDRHGDPTEFHFFSTRAEALGAISPIEVSVLALHERLLGKTAEACCGEGKGFASAPGISPDARVVMTMLGLAGDAGMGSGLYFALLKGPSRKRWTESFERFAETREVVRGVPIATISGASFLMTANVAMDLGAWLPPFVPSGRNQEGPVAFALQHISPDQFIGHLPYVVIHQPPESRAATLEQAVEAVEKPHASHLLMMCMSMLALQELEADAAAERLGRFLVACTDDPDAFQQLLRERARQFQRVRLGRLEDVLASRTAEPEAWAVHVRRLLRAAEHALEAPDYPIALDMQGEPEQRRAQVRSYVRGYGELLTAWPVLRAVARDLRRSGRGLIPE
jgi:hypothetical protein